MPAIVSVSAKEILDSRGNPTVHVALTLDSGHIVETSVPNGIRHYGQESFVLYDQDPHHMDGKGVGKAVALINQTIGPQLVGQDPTQQTALDQWLLQLDPTPQKTQAGANTFTALSQAILKAGAVASGLPLYHHLINTYHLTEGATIPVCLYGLVNGGQYGAGNLDIQEFLIIPASHVDYRVSLEIENSLRSELQKILRTNKANYSMGELGGFTPFLQKNTDVFEFIIEAARNTPYILARDFFFGIDSGAEMMTDRGKYLLKDKSVLYSDRELLDFYKSLREQFHLTYFEDPFTAKDTAAWKMLTEDLGDTTRIAGDIITATNPKLVQQAVQDKTCNTLVVKPSQIGTVTEAIEAIRIARAAGWSIVISQRTGETNDDFLADFAVGVGAEFVKFGPTNRGEAVSKYNRLADIYRDIEKAVAQGATPMTDATQLTNPVPAVDEATLPEQPAPVEPAMAEPDLSLDEPPMNIPQNVPPAMPAAPATPPAPTQPTAEAPVAPAPPAATPPTQATADLSQPVAVTPPAPSVPPMAAEPSSPLPPPTVPPAPSVPPVAPLTPPLQTPTEPAVNVAPTPSPSQPADTQPLEMDMQKTIDSTLAEIGAQPPAPAVTETPSEPSDQPASLPPEPPLS